MDTTNNRVQSKVAHTIYHHATKFDWNWLNYFPVIGLGEYVFNKESRYNAYACKFKKNVHWSKNRTLFTLMLI